MEPLAESPPDGAVPGLPVSPFRSVLFGDAEPPPDLDQRQAPACFRDLNLDRVIDAITAGRDEYNLKPFFYTPLTDLATVSFRHEILRDLELEAVSRSIDAFSRQMRSMNQRLVQAEKLRYKYEKEACLLDAAAIYCEAVIRLARDPSLADARSRGLQSFRDYVRSYAASDAFTSLAAETDQVKADLGEVRYSLNIKGTRIKVSLYGGEADYSAEVQETFEKFRQGAVKDYRAKFVDGIGMNHVEAGVLDLVAQLRPDVFGALDDYWTRNRRYLDATLATFDREIQFYVAYRDYVKRFERTGLCFCRPRMSDHSKEAFASESFDLALADKLTGEGGSVVCNDWHLNDPERIFVVSGPNQGGKTTFARTFGQLHYLASLGCPVPGRDAQLFLCDRVFTHFERREDLTDLSGKLEQDLVRVHEILDRATPQSILIMNESFGSTALQDAIVLGTRVLERIKALDLLCVYVTFVDELAFMGEKIVSVTSMVDPQDAAVRTYKVIRRPADGRAYAAAIAQKYGLTYEELRGRIAP